MEITDVPLVEFYTRQLNNVRKNGFIMLILALVREADAPSFYSDIIRYWDDLHDITGKKVLFLLAGLSEKKYAPEAAILEGLHCSQILIPPQRYQGKEQNYVEVTRLSYSAFEAHKVDSKNITFTNSQPRSAEDLASYNARQITELRQLLNIPESRIPCLHVTLLSLGEPFSVVIPIDEAAGWSVWTVIKRLMIGLDESLQYLQNRNNFDNYGQMPSLLGERERQQEEISTLDAKIYSLSGILERIDNVVNAIKKAERNFARCRTFLSKAADSAGETPEGHALRGVLSTTSVGLPELDDEEGRGHVLRLIATAEKVVASRAATSALRNLQTILSNQPILPDESSDRPLLEEKLSQERQTRRIWEKRRAATRLAMDKELQQAQDAYLNGPIRASICASLETCASATPAQSGGWKIFLSYAKPDEGTALEVWRALRHKGACFFAPICLRPQRQWQIDIEAAIETARIFICIITENTKKSHFQRAEIIRAVNLYRQKGTQIVVAQQVGAGVPLGLEPFQAIVWKTPQEAAQLLEGLNAAPSYGGGRLLTW
jgi:hypothetical protein